MSSPRRFQFSCRPPVAAAAAGSIEDQGETIVVSKETTNPASMKMVLCSLRKGPHRGPAKEEQVGENEHGGQ